MRDNLHKSKTNILSSSKIRNCIWSISLTSARKREKVVRQKIQTWNITELNSASHCKNVQKSKHQDFESRNVHKLIACLSEHAARQDRVMQLNQWSYAENQTSMQTDTYSSDECQSHHLLFFYHQESNASKQFNLRRCENTVEMQVNSFCCNDFD